MMTLIMTACRAILMAQIRAIVRRAALAEMREYSKAEMKRVANVAFELTGDKFVAQRFVKLDNKIRRKISWVAMKDALNEYRNIARREWRAAPVKNPQGVTRRAIAGAYRIKRIDKDTIAVGVSYSKSKARKANLLEWNTRVSAGKQVGTNTFEDNKTRLMRIIGESVRVQILKDPENNKARRQAVRARLGTA